MGSEIKANLFRELEIAKKIARDVGEILNQYRKIKESEFKKDGSVKKRVDDTSGFFIIDNLSRNFPEDAVLSEEDNDGVKKLFYNRTTRRAWVVDPVDGSRHFPNGNNYGPLIALLDEYGPLIGVAYNVPKKELFWGMRGMGSYSKKEGKRIKRLDLNREEEIRIVISESRRDGMIKRMVEELVAQEEIMGSSFKGVAVANGAANLWMVLPGKKYALSVWDIATNHILLDEMGGYLTDAYGNEINYKSLTRKNTRHYDGLICAANKKIHDRVIEMMLKYLT